MKRILATALAATLLAACGSSNDSTDNTPKLGTAAEINTYLAGKSWKMAGADIPAFPNGFNANTNYGAATQCYNETVIATNANWAVTTKLGTLTGAPTVGSTGTCDKSTPAGSPLSFTSTAILIENVGGNGDCFDVTATYATFAQAGRGKFSADGKTMTLELYFSTQATKNRCADGAVGSATVTLNGVTNYDGSKSLQVYRLQ
ncbi:MAG: hypothetical protein U0229_22315 [Anaeromyxobacter sp.]